MRFYTDAECETWLTDRRRTKPDVNSTFIHTIHFPAQKYRIYSIAHWLASSCMKRQPALLWITEWAIWPSSENWHLYYKLRQSYGNLDLLQEKPGHYFLGYQAEDFTSFFQLAILNGWGGYFLSESEEVNAFFSHDEYMLIFAREEQYLTKARQMFPANHHT